MGEHFRDTLIFVLAAALLAHALHIKDAQDWARYKVAHNCEQVESEPQQWECDNNTTITRP